MRRLAIPAAVLVILLAAWWLQSSLEKKKLAGPIKSDFLKLDCSRIDCITTAPLGENLNLVKLDGIWHLDGESPHRADQYAVENILSRVCTLAVGNVFSDNPARQKDFMVDNETGNLVSFYAGESLLAQVYVGRLNPEMTAAYIRKPESDEVYLAPPALSFAFHMTRAQWIDKTVFKFDRDSLRDVEIIYPDKSYRLIRHDQNRWEFVKEPIMKGFEPAAQPLTVFLSQVCDLRAVDLVNASDNGKVDFENWSLVVRVNPINGESQSIEFAAVPPGEKVNRYYIRRSGSPDTLVVSNLTYATQAKDYDSFPAPQ